MELGCWFSRELGRVPWLFSSQLRGFLGFPSQHVPGQEMLVGDWLEIGLSQLGYSQWQFGIPRKGLILEKWWDWLGGWIPWLSGVFQGFSDSRLEFQLG